MSMLFKILVTALVGLVALVLVLGLSNMMRNGDTGLSQKLMRLRVGLQFLAVIAIMLSVYFVRG